MTWAPETTWLLRQHPHCLTRKAGEALVDRVNKWLTSVTKDLAMALYAKLDPYRISPTTCDTTGWCVEIIPVPSFQSAWLYEADDRENHVAFMGLLDALFAGLSSKFDLVPSITTRQRGRERHWPSAGCHIHFGADLFSLSYDWYHTMERFHRNLVTDFANRPYIRWLLAQWFDNENSSCLVTERDFPQDGRAQKDAFAPKPPDADLIWTRAIYLVHSIEPRFQVTSKSSYLTFELRFINMVETSRELRDVAVILHHWVESIRMQTRDKKDIPLTISRSDLLTYKRLHTAQSIVNSWLDSIMEPASLRDHIRPTVATLFQRNYRNRVLYGKMI